MSFVFSIKDSLRQSVEASSGGRNTVIYDDKGYPSIMVIIPRFNLSDINPNWENVCHPAFDVDGVMKSEIFVSKYPNVVHDGRGYSLPHVDPASMVTFDNAKSYCTNKGKGWHLFSNAERAAIALYSLKNGTQPFGNNSHGKDFYHPNQRGTIADETVLDNGKYTRTKTGGNVNWSHTHDSFGIYDLNGNVAEWLGGVKYYKGSLYVAGDNNTARNNYDAEEKENSVDGFLNLNLGFDSLGNYTSSEPANDSENVGKVFSSVSGGNEVMEHLALAPVNEDTLKAGLRNDYLYVKKALAEFIPVFGGSFADELTAGVFSLNFSLPRSYAGLDVGFRSAYTN